MAKKKKGSKVLKKMAPQFGGQLTVPKLSELSRGLREMRTSKTPRVKGGM